MGVAADLGTEVDGGKWANRIYPDVIKNVHLEWGNERDGVGFKIGNVGDKVEEITLVEFFL